LTERSGSAPLRASRPILRWGRRVVRGSLPDRGGRRTLPGSSRRHAGRVRSL